MTEHEFTVEVVRLLRSLGAVVLDFRAAVKRTGVAKGWPDLVYARAGRTTFLELKVAPRGLTSDQRDVIGSLEHAGASVRVLTLERDGSFTVSSSINAEVAIRPGFDLVSTLQELIRL